MKMMMKVTSLMKMLLMMTLIGTSEDLGIRTETSGCSGVWWSTDRDVESQKAVVILVLVLLPLPVLRCCCFG